MARRSDYSWLWMIGGALAILYFVSKSKLNLIGCGTDITGTNTCLQRGPTVLPVATYSTQGGATPATVFGDNPTDYWDMLAAIGQSLG